MLKRKLCPICNANLVAINYIKDGITHYRKTCTSCNRKGKKLKSIPPAWTKSGYKKMDRCEKCGFNAKIPDQLCVFYVDGNLKNNNWLNLKTICLNCAAEIHKSKTTWKPSPLIPDF